MSAIRQAQVRRMNQATDPGESGPVPIVDITPFTTDETRGRADVAKTGSHRLRRDRILRD